jgi:copper transport protein
MPRRLVVVIAVLIAALGLPTSAFAHAVLEANSPANDELLKVSPTAITLTFSERIEPVGAIQLFDGDAKQMSVGDQQLVSPNVTRTPITAPLTPGTYTVAWRALSSDGHAINGAFVFHVKKRGPNPNGIIGTIGTGSPPSWIRILSSMARWWNLSMLILVIGGIVALTTFMSRRAGAGEAKLWYTVSGSAFVLSISSAVTVVLQGAELRGLTIGGANTGGMIGDVVTTQFGKVRVAQLLIAEVIAVVAVWGVSSHRGLPTVATLWTGAGLLALTPALSGHAVSLGVTGVLTDAIHVAAASIWTGGLVFIALALVLATDRGTVAAQVLPRFSRVAVACVGIVVLSGALGGLRELDGVGNLFSTRYGWHLVIKIGLALLLIGVGGLNRWTLRSSSAVESAPTVRRLRRQLTIELVLLLGVLAITTLLIAEPPARAVGSGTGPVTVSTSAGDTDVRIVVEPARVGPNLVNIYLSKDRRSVDPDEVRVAFTNTKAGLGPISAPTERNEPGHYLARSVPLSAAGTWTITVRLRTGEFDSTDATVSVVVGKAPAR